MLASDVVARANSDFVCGNADDAECGMVGRLGELALESFKAAPHDVGLAEAKL
jgi:hypothetical protein